MKSRFSYWRTHFISMKYIYITWNLFLRQYIYLGLLVVVFFFLNLLSCHHAMCLLKSRDVCWMAGIIKPKKIFNFNFDAMYICWIVQEPLLFLFPLCRLCVSASLSLLLCQRKCTWDLVYAIENCFQCFLHPLVDDKSGVDFKFTNFLHKQFFRAFKCLWSIDVSAVLAEIRFSFGITT